MKIAHLSDLHIGQNAARVAAARQLVEALRVEDVDLVVVSGDVTHRGRWSEFWEFSRIMAPIVGKIVTVPGNHDRLGDDVGEALMPGFRVHARAHGAAWVVRFNSTGPHNRRWLDGHGLLTQGDVQDIEQALRAGPRGAARLLVMHHHPLPLPDEHVMEKLVTRLGWPNARELARGPELIEKLRFSCDAVLHGHRHVPAETAPFPGEPLRVFNGGSSTELLRCRILRWTGGEFESRWLEGRSIPEASPRSAAADLVELPGADGQLLPC